MSQAGRRHFESRRPHCAATACSTFAPHFGDKSAPGRLGDRGPGCGRNLAFSRKSLLHLTVLLRDLRVEGLEKSSRKLLERGGTIPVRPAKNYSAPLDSPPVSKVKL